MLIHYLQPFCCSSKSYKEQRRSINTSTSSFWTGRAIRKHPSACRRKKKDLMKDRPTKREQEKETNGKHIVSVIRGENKGHRILKSIFS